MIDKKILLLLFFCTLKKVFDKLGLFGMIRNNEICWEPFST